MMHLRREVVTAQGIGGELPVSHHPHAALAFARGVGISILALGALGMFLVGALALATVAFMG